MVRFWFVQMDKLAYNFQVEMERRVNYHRNKIKKAPFISPFFLFFFSLTKKALMAGSIYLSFYQSIHLFLGLPFTCFELFVLFCFLLSSLSWKKPHMRIQRGKERSDPLLHHNHRSLFLSPNYLYPSDDAAPLDSITKISHLKYTQQC